MKQLTRERHRHLLEDERIKRWYDNLCRGSKVTADVYTRRLGSICSMRGTNPSELVERGREGNFEPTFTLDNLIKDLVFPTAKVESRNLVSPTNPLEGLNNNFPSFGSS